MIVIKRKAQNVTRSPQMAVAAHGADERIRLFRKHAERPETAN